jgi:hypothetical protein
MQKKEILVFPSFQPSSELIERREAESVNQPTTPLRSASASLVRWYDDIWEYEWASVGKLS